MDVELIFKIAAVGIIVAVLSQLLIRSGREEQAMLTTLAGLIVVLTMIITQISALFETIKRLFIERLRTAYHARVSYPSEVKANVPADDGTAETPPPYNGTAAAQTEK